MRNVLLTLVLAACSIDAPERGMIASELAAPCKSAGTQILLRATSRARTYRYAEVVAASTYAPGRVDTPTYAAFLDFLAEVNERVDVDVFDQRALLERQRAIFERYLGAEAAELHRRVLDGEVGTLGDTTCLESALFDLQSRDWPLSAGPVEMGALVLERTVGDVAEVRAYVKTQAQSTVAGISMADVMARVDADLERGWQLRAHLHSHPLFPDARIDVAGTVIPSDADAATYRRLRDSHGLQEAWIINGADAAVYRADELDRL
jgi:hypothetical protein